MRNINSMVNIIIVISIIGIIWNGFIILKLSIWNGFIIILKLRKSCIYEMMRRFDIVNNEDNSSNRRRNEEDIYIHGGVIPRGRCL